MTVLRNAAWILALGTVLLGGCNGTGAGDDGPRELFGNGMLESSRVVARVNGEPITETMMELRLNEMGPSERNRFSSEEGRRLLAHRMVEEMLHARAAEELKLDRDPVVSQVLIAQYRQAMELAHRNEVLKGLEPSVDEVREYFEQNREQYVKLGTMQASHIETKTRQEATRAYRALTEENRSFDTVCREFSTNKETAINGGDLGWFNPGGFVPGIRDSKTFTQEVWELEQGINAPIEVGGMWHVVAVVNRQLGRMQTLDEAYERVASDLLPTLQQRKLREWASEAKQAAEVEYFAEFRPGLGKTPKELLERAFNQADPQAQAMTLKLLIEDFPDDEYTDDAMFMAANLHLDTWGDSRQASVYLVALLKRFPDSEYAADSKYILDNMNKPGFQQPRSIEDLRGN